MNKKDLIKKVAERLREEGKRKPVTIKKHRFTITDEEDNAANFFIKQKEKEVLYTVDDVANIIDACISVVVDSVRMGEAVNIFGFGSLFLHYRAARKTKAPETNDWYDVEARFVPKFTPGKDLKMAAKLFELDAHDVKNNEDEVVDIYGD